MKFLVRFKRVFCLASVMLMFISLVGLATASAEKIGVLVLHSGMDEEYKPDWMPGYFEHLFLFFPPGFYAGGPLEGGDCYTLVHYATMEEADMCTDIGIPVLEGTPIDIFCNTYDPAVTNIHSIRDHFNSADGTIVTDCFDDPIGIGNAMLTTHSTIDPVTGEEIIGPHIDGGPGIGVADFAEIGAFGRMEDLVHAFPGERNPYREQIVKWIFGERYQTIYPSYPSRYGWPVDNRSNIWDELEAAILADPTIPAGTEVVFRQGSESYMWNRDIYGNPSVPIADSTEQGLRDLILTENVDRVIVLAALASYTNLNNFGHCWNDENGNGISAIPGKTYYECIMDTSDGVGPGDEALRDDLVHLKPWGKYKMPYPEIWEMVETIEAERSDPEFTIHEDLTFTTDYGDEATYPEAWLEMLNFTVNNYGINDNGSNLKVVLALHGYNGGFIWPPSAAPEGAAWCDVYHREAFIQAQTTVDYIKNNFTWNNGAFDVTMAESEYAEPSSEGGINDDPALNPPFGNRWSIGEVIDDSIYGTYINELGAVVNNNADPGKTKYEQIVVLPFTWDAESIDTIEHLRHVTGNMEYQFIQGQWMWARSGHEEHEEEEGGEDPHGHGDSPFDQYYFTEEIFDGTEHCTIPEGGVDPVCKGDPVNSSRLVVTGCALSLPEGPWRTNFTQAAVDSIIGAMKNPNIGGELDEVCMEESIPNDLLPEIIAAPYNRDDGNTLSTDPAAPTAMSSNIMWEYYDDQASCSGITHQWQYRVAGTTDPMTLITLQQQPMSPEVIDGNYYLQWVWSEQVWRLGSGTYEMQAVVTDCLGQSATSTSYYFTVDMLPEITLEPTRVSDSVILSADPVAPTPVLGDDYIFWTFVDDQASCEGITLQWQYRTAGTADPMTVNTVYPDEQGGGSYLQWAWTDYVNTLGTGTYEIQVIVTDCAGQSVTSGSYYFRVDMPPQITEGPLLSGDSTPLSTDPSSPTTVVDEATGSDIYWTYTDDKATCTAPASQAWLYRVDDTQEWSIESAGNYLQWIWIEDISAVTGSGTFQLKAVATDCADQTVESPVHYILVP